MKIGIVTEYYYPYLGGISEHVHNLYLHLKKRGIDVKIVMPKMNGMDDRSGLVSSRAEDADIIYIGRSLPFYNNGGFARFTNPIGLAKKVKKLLANEEFDLIHIQSPLIPILPLMFLCYADCPLVGTVHTIFKKNCPISFGYKLFKKGVERRMEKLSAKIAVSPMCQDVMKRYFDHDYTIVPNGIDTNLYHPGATPIPELKSDGIRNILFLGRFDPHNGLDILIKAFRKLIESSGKYRLIVVGHGPLEKLYRKECSDISGHVHFAGPQHKLKPNYYRTADIFCHPATLHSQSIVSLEAMASGLPTVASDIESFRWCFGDAAEFFPAGDAIALAGTLTKLINDDDRKTELSSHARRRAHEFSWDVIGDRIVEIYKQVLVKK